MEQLFRKHFWIVQLAIVAIVAILLAAAVNRFFGSWLTRFTVPPIPEVGELADHDDARERPFVPDTVFGETEPPPPPDPCADVECDEGEECRQGECVALDEDAPEDEDAQPVLPEGRCLDSDIAINLAGTMVATDPEWSLAILHNPSDNRTYFARVGKMLLDEAEVLRIERNRVFLLRDGIEECLRHGDQSERSRRRQAALEAAGEERTRQREAQQASSRDRPEARQRAEEPPQRPSGQSLQQRVEEAVEQRGPNQYSINREVLQEAANNSAFMQQQAPQVVPMYQDGQASGFRLQGVRSDSIFAQLGIRNGDVLRSVDGQVIDSPQRALQLFESLMNEDRVQLEVVRGGRSVEIEYGLQ